MDKKDKKWSIFWLITFVLWLIFGLFVFWPDHFKENEIIFIIIYLVALVFTIINTVYFIKKRKNQKNKDVRFNEPTK